MNNPIIEFTDKTFGKIRAINIDGNPWFVGKDIADALGYDNSRKAIIDHVDIDDKNTVTIRDGIPGNPNKTIINESGLYSLILSSKLPSAKKFKRWVTANVLPSLRKHGAYLTDEVLEEVLGSPEFAHQLFSELEEEKHKNEILIGAVIELEPKASFCESVLECQNDIDNIS